MNRLSLEKRVQVVAALVEGSSINSIARMTGVAKHTILGIADHVWSSEELVALLDVRAATRAA